VWNKIKPYFIGAGIGLIVGIIATWAISSNYSNSKIEQLSNNIAIGAAENSRLLDTNKILTERNRLDQETINGLRNQIISDNNIINGLRNQIISDNNITKGKLDKVSSGLGTIAEGLAGTEGTIQDVIEGIESIKDFIKILSSI
jgi:hypothetical protein